MDLEKALENVQQSVVNEEIIEMLVMIEARQIVTHSILSKIYGKLFNEDSEKVETALGIQVAKQYEDIIQELEKRLEALKK